MSKRKNPPRGRVQVVLVTAPEKDAGRIARTLLNERLIACANLIGGVRSIYWWQGELEQGSETLLVLKAPRRLVPRLLTRVKAIHPYDVPEFLALDVAAGNNDYLAWVLSEARGRQ